MNDQKTENNVTAHNSSVANYYAMEVDTHISDTITSDVDLFKCPNCKNFSIIDFKKAEYCFVCGQKIILGQGSSPVRNQTIPDGDSGQELDYTTEFVINWLNKNDVGYHAGYLCIPENKTQELIDLIVSRSRTKK